MPVGVINMIKFFRDAVIQGLSEGCDLIIFIGKKISIATEMFVSDKCTDTCTCHIIIPVMDLGRRKGPIHTHIHS